MQCRIDSINHKGEGVARIDGKATFVPGALPGELVDVEILESKARYDQAILKNIIEASEDRISPDCFSYNGCGGCAYQHVSYRRELEIKRKIIEDSLKRIGKLSVQVDAVIGMDEPVRYRNKVVWHVIHRQLGYYQPLSHKLVPIDSCCLISQEMERIIKPLKKLLPSLSFTEPGEIILRQSSLDRELMVILGNLRSYPSSMTLGKLTELCSSIYGKVGTKFRLLFGQESLTEEIHGLRFKVSPESFFQVNHRQTEKIIEIVLKYLNLDGNENVLDAYCGVGSISLNLARQARSVIGIENNVQAVEDAIENATVNQLYNCEFIAGTCEKILPKLKKTFDASVIDPPRGGCRPEVIDALISTGVKTIIYVSCNPSTLARDLASFAQSGYRIARVQPVDMFPRTMHVETVVLIERK